MFGRKKTVSVIHLYDSEGNTILSCPCSQFTLPEQTQVNLSIIYYNDPEPCEIHRGAVTKRALLEISALCEGGTGIDINELSELQQTYFPPEAVRVSITEETK